MYCRQCHYDLRHLDNGVCPECGAGFDEHSADTYLAVIPPRRGRVWAMAILLAVAASTAVVSLGDEVATLLIFIVSAAISGVIGAIDVVRRNSPVAYRGYGGYGGALCAVAVTCLMVLAIDGWFAVGYFFYQGARPYFEDGWVNDVFVYPLMACFIYGLAAGVIGMLTGTMASLCVGLMGRGQE